MLVDKSSSYFLNSLDKTRKFRYDIYATYLRIDIIRNLLALVNIDTQDIFKSGRIIWRSDEMKFCEKVKEARTKAGLKQDEFAKAIGVSLRTVSNYEAGTRYPKKRETYYKMAEVLKVDVNYLLTDDEEFLLNAESKYGSKGARQAKELMAEVTGLFAGGELADEDLDEMMKGIQEAYWIAKEKNKKYTPKKYQK